ncbi:ubiquinone-binding protein [Gammaproteobacteria bacterium]|nr:ubiquinone-binding protein [Gammaproteobacteria bacterium]
MAIIRKTKNEPYSAEQMYRLVNDVEAYPEFLPWCGDTRISDITQTSMKAAIKMQKGPLDKWFSTQNTLEYGKRIQLNLLDGPFRKLHGDWQFEEINAHESKVKLVLEFEFGFGMIGILLEPIFNSIASTLVDSFSERARQIYLPFDHDK